MLGLVSDLAGAVASRISPELLPSTNLLPPRENTSAERLQHHVPKNLDLHYITDRIIGMAQLAEAPFPTRVDPGRDSTTNTHDSCENDVGHPSEETDTTAGSRPLSPTEPSQPLSPQAIESSADKEEKFTQQPKGKRKGNCPATLSTFLGRRHPNRFLLVNLSEQDADDRALLLLNRQISRFRWSSPCLRRSETPSLHQLFDICYALHAYLSLDKDRVALIYCSNGKTRTAIVVACYLKFAGLVRTAMDGFRYFCTRRCPDLDPTKIADQIPPSLQTFFRNFSNCVDLGGFSNPKPLLLRAVALQGVPIDDKPCIDIWDTDQNLIYSSHPVWKDDVDENNGQKPLPSQWADEEGFYRIDKVITGDFVLLCRFGGPYADDTDDPSTVLFRYANHSGFLCAAPYEFPKGKVDMMRRYGSSFDDEDFLLTFMFESSVGASASANATSEENEQLCCKRCLESSLPSILEGLPALERGWEIIADAHAARPAARDVKLITDDKTLGCSDTAASLMLQLTNHDVNAARKVLTAKLSSVPKTSRKRPYTDEANAEDEEGREVLREVVSKNTSEQSRDDRATPELTAEIACSNIMQIINDTDFGIDIEWVDNVEDDMSTDWEILNRQDEDTEVDDPVALYGAPMMFPNQGDVVNAFGNYNVAKGLPYPSLTEHDTPPSLGSRPKMQMGNRKRRRRNSNEETLTHKNYNADRIGKGTSGSRSPIQGYASNQEIERAESFLDNKDPTAAMDLLLKLNHTGITLQGLLDLQKASRGWTGQVKNTTDSETGGRTGHLTAEARDRNSKSGFNRSAVRDIAGRIENGGIQNLSRAKGQNETANKATYSGSNRVMLSDEEALHSTSIKAGVVGVPNVTNKDFANIDPTVLYNLAMKSLGSGTSTSVSSGGTGVRNIAILSESSMQDLQGGFGSSGPHRDFTPAEAIAALHSLAMQKVGTPTLVKGSARGSQAVDATDATKQDGGEHTSNKNSQLESNKNGSKDSDALAKVESTSREASKAEETSKTDDASSKESGDPPLKEDPEYKKYFKMLEVGLPIEAVKHALQRDGKDPSIMDLDPEKSLKSQTEPQTAESNEETPLKEDPDYAKYFKMLGVGLPIGAVKNAMQRDGKDPSIMDLDPQKSLKSQTEAPAKDNADGPPLKDDPEYAKYFKMLKMGLPMGAVKNALQRDGKDPSIMDLDHNKSVKSQTEGRDKEDDGPPLKEDPDYAKYFKMLAVGLPIGAVKQAMQRDGKDPSIMDLDHNKSVKSQMSNDADDNGVPLKDDPEYSKYFKMLKMGLPMGAVKNALVRDGKDPSIMDLDHNKSVKSQTEGEDKEDDGPPLKEDPEYEKYFKMLRLKLPMGAVKQAMQRDGKDPSIMDLDHNRSVKSQMSNDADDNGVPLKDDPEYSKYFKMLKMGLPMGAVKNALQRDEKDASIMDLDPNKSVAFQLNSRTRRKTKKSQKKKVRRKKIYWTPIDPTKLNDDSIWSLVKGTVAMDQLKYDMKEFENLFTESSNPAEKKAKEGGGGDKKPAQKKSVQVIDGKRGMNGGIILARLKLEYSKIAEMVDKMEYGNLDGTQLRALKEFLPSDEERPALEMYLKKGEKTEKAMAEALAAMSECEKYMVAMMKVKKAAEKFDCMLFKSQFQSRYDEITEARETVQNACEEVRTSERLRKMMAMILTLVNEINTGGTGNIAIGFSLDALLKLSEAKAFDKKTSVLHYLVKIVRENDKTLVELKSDIPSTIPAENVILEGLASDIKALSEELSSVHDTVKEDADRLEESGEIPNMSVTQLSEQRTEVRQIEGQPHYNKIDHLTGRTPMEKFTLRAQETVQEALDSIKKLQENYAKLLEYFGEDETMPSDAFFGIINKFVVSFENAAQQVEEAEKKRQKEKLRAAAKAAAMSKKSSTTRASPSNAQGKKNSKKTKDFTRSNPASANEGAGIAATVAMRSREKNNDLANTDKAHDTEGDVLKQPPTLAVGAGGIAAAAAAAAALRTTKIIKESDDTASSPKKVQTPAIGGIGIAAAAAAAAAALRAPTKEDAIQTESNTNNIAKSESTFSADRKLLKLPPNLAVGGEGVAAAAAAAAALRSKAKNSENKSTSTASPNVADGDSHSAVGNEGAIAAAALRSISKNPENESTSTTPSVVVDSDSHSGVSNVGGIAAAAAAAAVLRTKAKENTSTTPSDVVDRGSHSGVSNGGGIAAAAAAAAAVLRSKAKDSEKESTAISPSDVVDSDSPSSVVDGDGIAAAAAAAAVLRTKPKKNASTTSLDVVDGDSPSSVVNGGGIAAAAAAAAMLRSKAKDSEKENASTTSLDVVNSDSPPTVVNGGGIAAAAAAAAVLRSKAKDSEKENASTTPSVVVDSGSNSSVVNGGGIAAAAAAAAMFRSKAKDSEKENASTTSLDVVNSNSPSSVVGGGIAAAAAAAAVLRSEAKDSEKENASTTPSDVDDDSSINGGGIAAAAVLRSKAKDSEKENAFTTPSDVVDVDLCSSVVNGGGIATAAAAAAVLRSKVKDSEKENASTTPSVVVDSGSNSSVVNGGGIAAAAAAAAVLRFKSKDPVKDNASTTPSDVVDGDSHSSGVNRGGIAAAAEAAAVLRTNAKDSEKENASRALLDAVNGDSPSDVGDGGGVEENTTKEMEQVSIDTDDIGLTKALKKTDENIEGNGFQRWLRSLSPEEVRHKPSEEVMETTDPKQEAADKNFPDEVEDGNASQDKAVNPFQSWFKGFS